jgi:hypothetical protein
MNSWTTTTGDVMPEFTAGALSLVNTTTAGDQSLPSIAALAGGGYVVAWHSSDDQAVYAQQYDAAGGRAGAETFIGHASAGSASVGLGGAGVAVAALAGGGFVIAYTQGDPGGPTSALAQRFDAGGHLVGGAVSLASSPDRSVLVSADSVEALPDGGWLVTYQRDSFPPSPVEMGTLYAQRFDAVGAHVGGELALAPISGTMDTSTAVLPDGGWVTAYDQFMNYHDGIVAFTQQFSSTGAAEHGNTINPDPSATEVAPQVAVLAGGRQAVVWFTPDQQPTWYHLQGQLLDSAGAPLGPAFDLANADGVLAGSAPQVTALASGGFVVSWEHDVVMSGSTSGSSTHTFDLRVQYFDANGHASGSALQVGPSVTMATYTPPAMQWSVTATPDGGFVVAVDENNGTTGQDVYAQKFSPAAPAVQAGTAGDDTLPVGVANAHIDGGPGTDTAVFDASLAAVQSYSIANGVVSVTTALGTDTLVNVERVRFNDALFALDTQAPAGGQPGGHAWEAAALFHAGFGVLPGVAEWSRWTADADHSGSMAVVAQHMIDAYAPGVSSADLVASLYRQLTHTDASAETVQSYADQVGAGQQFATQGDLVAWAASLPANADAIAGIVGTAQPLDPSFF